ncbi:MAG: nickel-dependent hydrogenase large subunit, partial [Candidatus Brocadiales bacterium]
MEKVGTLAREIHTKEMTLQMGPSHPAMHGTVRMFLELDGETVVSTDVHIGYLHRGFEKMCENRTYHQAIIYTDRLNYVSPLINNFGYAMAVEKLFGVDVPERCKYIRTIMSEISRITDHLTCVAATAMELGALTAFLYMIKAREELWKLIEDVSGGRGVTPSYVRIGGVKDDLPEDFRDKAVNANKLTREVLKEIHGLLTKNRIFVDRVKGVGVITTDEAISYGFTGPCLRSTGVPYDVRKAHPYMVYEQMDFDVPVGTNGDNYDRYLCRME